MAVDEGTADPAAGCTRVSSGPNLGVVGWQKVVTVVARVAVVVALLLVAAFTVRYAVAPGGANPEAANEELVGLLLGLLGAVAALAVVVFHPERGDLAALTRTAAVWSVALVATLGGVWYLIDADVREEIGVGTPVFDQAEVDAYLARAVPAGATGAPPVRVPTGVLIQSIEFLNANNVQVAGFVWQRYDASIPPEVTRGFVLPEAVDNAYQAEQAYAFEENGAQVIGWRVHATLRQPFDYRRFPFDRQDVGLRLWPQDLDRGVILVPDFAAYADADPAAMPGLDPRFVYGGWSPEYAAFSFAEGDSGTTLGYAAESTRFGDPDLFFNVGLKRDFLGPFFDHIVLALAVALLLFVVLTLTTDDDDLQRRFGFNTAGVVGSASGLLFAVILKHNQIRSSVGSGHVAYLEAIPFVLYLFIVLVAVNAIVLASPLNVPAIEYKKNALPTLVFWPGLLGALLVITVAVFYG